jgi:DNA-directed RNA polymerase specialized sigma24 family protein
MAHLDLPSGTGSTGDGPWSEQVRRIVYDREFLSYCARLANSARASFEAGDLQAAVMLRFAAGHRSPVQFLGIASLAAYLRAVARSVATDWIRGNRSERARLSQLLPTLARARVEASTRDATKLKIDAEEAAERRRHFGRVVAGSFEVLRRRDYFMSACCLMRNLYGFEYNAVADCFETALGGHTRRTGHEVTEYITDWVNDLVASAELASVPVPQLVNGPLPQQPLSATALLARLSLREEDLVALKGALDARGSGHWAYEGDQFGRLRSWSHQMLKAIRAHLLAHGISGA